MLYATLAYRRPKSCLTPEEDAALMTNLFRCTTGSTRKNCSGRQRGSVRRRTPAPCGVRGTGWCSTGRLPKPKSNCWGYTW